MVYRCDVGRRRFVANTLGMMSASALYATLPVWGRPSLDDEEAELRRAASHTMLFCSPYASTDALYSSAMHLSLKKHIQALSKGRIYVDLVDTGGCGIGTQLMAMVSRGQIASALVSVSNLSPAVPELDILNIPFWCADNQAYLNLVTSGIWRRQILNEIEERGRMKLLLHYLPGARTLSSTKRYNRTIKLPRDLKNVTFRIPPSRALKRFYSMAGTNPVDIGWQDTAHMAAAGRFDVLDPGIIGLYIGPHRLREHIGVITEIDSVYDGWVAVISQAWLNGLPNQLKDAVEEAAKLTFREHLSLAPQSTALCRQGFLDLGTRFYTPSEEEKSRWIACCGYQRPEWDRFKTELLGDRRRFDALLAATRDNNGYHYGSR